MTKPRLRGPDYEAEITKLTLRGPDFEAKITQSRLQGAGCEAWITEPGLWGPDYKAQIKNPILRSPRYEAMQLNKHCLGSRSGVIRFFSLYPLLILGSKHRLSSFPRAFGVKRLEFCDNSVTVARCW